MKVKVVSERECCDYHEDLVPFRAIDSSFKPHMRAKFCKYCGQVWYLKRFTDAAGDSDSEYVKAIIKAE